MGLVDCFEKVRALVGNSTTDRWSVVCCLLFGASTKEGTGEDAKEVNSNWSNHSRSRNLGIYFLP